VTTAIKALPQSLHDFAETHLGTISNTTFRGWELERSNVWELDSSKGKAYIKALNLRKYRQELRAFETWLPNLESYGVQTPKLIAASEEIEVNKGVLIISAVDGVLVEGSTSEFDVDVHEQAGKFLRAFHDIEFEDVDKVDLFSAYIKRFEGWSKQGQAQKGGGLEPTLYAWIKHHLDSTAPLLQNVSRVPCHRDYTPRNWLVNSATSLGIIDFEHSNPDLWLADTHKLWSAYWIKQPELETAFWQGYGHTPSDDERLLSLKLATLENMVTTVWSIEHGDKTYEAHGRKMLAHLQKELG